MLASLITLFCEVGGLVGLATDPHLTRSGSKLERVEFYVMLPDDDIDDES